jgi:hypothetical protein
MERNERRNDKGVRNKIKKEGDRRIKKIKEDSNCREEGC